MFCFFFTYYIHHFKHTNTLRFLDSICLRPVCCERIAKHVYCFGPKSFYCFFINTRKHMCFEIIFFLSILFVFEGITRLKSPNRKITEKSTYMRAALWSHINRRRLTRVARNKRGIFYFCQYQIRSIESRGPYTNGKRKRIMQKLLIGYVIQLICIIIIRLFVTRAGNLTHLNRFF